jgi:hypothetical protein
LEGAPERIPVDRLRELIGAPNPVISKNAEQALRKRLANAGPEALPELRKGLEHPSYKVRLVYIDAIGALKLQGEKAAPDLERLLGTPECSEYAARALDAVGKLLEVASRAEKAKSLAVALATLRAKPEQTKEMLDLYRKQLAHADAGVRTEAGLALLEHDPTRLDIDDIVILKARLKGEPSGAAEKHLKQRLGDSTAKDLMKLQKGLGNPEPDIQLAFVDAIAELGKSGRPATKDLTKLFSSSNDEIAVRSILAMQKLGKSDGAIPALEQAVKDDRNVVSAAAVKVLSDFDPSNRLLAPTVAAEGVEYVVDQAKFIAGQVYLEILATSKKGDKTLIATRFEAVDSQGNLYSTKDDFTFEYNLRTSPVKLREGVKMKLVVVIRDVPPKVTEFTRVDVILYQAFSDIKQPIQFKNVRFGK